MPIWASQGEVPRSSTHPNSYTTQPSAAPDTKRTGQASPAHHSAGQSSRFSAVGEKRELLGQVIGDKYGVRAVIGEGGMGAVYEAEHLQIGRLVAVKVLHPKEAQKQEAVSRLEHEARVAGRIGHPNICEVYDMGRLADGSPYLVMERLHGETLAERIRRTHTVPAHELVDITLQVLSALVTAHERGIIHRDLKPENIFLSQRAGMLPVAKLLDFGISKASSAGDAALNLTRTGMVMGTPYYMAPEQARGEPQLDHRVDLWAMGVILYEALTGQRPFVAKNYNALLVQILTLWHRPVTELNPAVPSTLSRIVDRALTKDREERFQRAAEFQEALLRFKKKVTIPPKRQQPQPRPKVKVHNIADEASDDGTMMFARVQEIRGQGEERMIVVSGDQLQPGAGPLTDVGVLPPSASHGSVVVQSMPPSSTRSPRVQLRTDAAAVEHGVHAANDDHEEPSADDSITIVRRDLQPRGGSRRPR